MDNIELSNTLKGIYTMFCLYRFRKRNLDLIVCLFISTLSHNTKSFCAGYLQR